MALIRIQSLDVSFGDKPVLANISTAIEAGERIALVGRNGTGKSTLLKIIAGQLSPDDGEIVKRQGVNVAYLQQDVPADLSGTIYEITAQGLDTIGQLLADWQQESLLVTDGTGDNNRLARLQEQIDACDGWRLGQRIESTLSRMQLNANDRFETLSGGMKRRVLLARSLVSDPDALLLDEPTNHLDVPAIEWLEEHLAGLRCALLFITHDRSFLKSLATRILELDRGQLTDWPGDYNAYLTGKAALLDEEDKHNALFDRKLAQEERWIRQGIKARRTRNEGRVRALKKMREERRQRIERTGSVNMQANVGGKSGRKVIEATQVTFGFGDSLLIKPFSTTIQRGDKVGIMGPNGTGKSTLVRLLLGKLEPDSGQIQLGTNLEIAYFDQLRTALNPNLTAMDNVSGGKDTIRINDQEKHIISYMQEFLFSPDRARAPITALSGGETNRLMLAKLFLQPSNVLVLDEPTNDLDIETLELLESLLADYPGTVIIISHDRAFIDNTVTSTIMYEGKGRFVEYVGGYQDWLHQRPKHQEPANPSGQRPKATTPADSPKPPTRRKKLSYKDQRELDQLPEAIAALEARIAELEAEMSQPDFYTSGKDTETVIDEVQNKSAELEQALERWVELEALLES